jgi:hypothetical protein
VVLLTHSAPALAQTVSHRGFVEGAAFGFPLTAPNDTKQAVFDGLVREEVFVRPLGWLQFAGGLDLRASSHDQVDDDWRPDFGDRGGRRPRLSIRRLTATINHGPLTLDVGKQFVRWGKTDIVNPTDRFAPRDFLNVVDFEYLGITAARASLQLGDHLVEAAWVPRFTPSRTPLLTERWAVLGPAPVPIALREVPAALPAGSQSGVRWGHVAARLEYSLSVYSGFNHLPDIRARVVEPAAPVPVAEIERSFPRLVGYGGDFAVPSRWFTIKGEAEYFSSPSSSTDEFLLYVLQVERQQGEWVFVGGYAGEAVTHRRSLFTFAPDRGMSRSLVARTAYTIDANRSVAIEGAVRQNGDGAYVKGEYSQARGSHWRITVAGVGIAGASDDFIGQYDRNSHLTVKARYSF